MARLRSKIWVQAYLKRLELQSIAAYVTAHGDDHSGAILIKVMKMDGSAKLFIEKIINAYRHDQQ